MTKEAKAKEEDRGALKEKLITYCRAFVGSKSPEELKAVVGRVWVIADTKDTENVSIPIEDLRLIMALIMTLMNEENEKNETA